jgi:small subunit ribosomal protein S13
MARIAGTEIPNDKQAWVAMTYVYGIGTTLSKKILQEAGVPLRTKVRELTDDQVSRINSLLEKNYVVEGGLRRILQQNISRLKEIACYRGLRHRRGLPVRGQQTQSNARTRKGPRKTVAGKKLAVK